jgi:hypothetical protein
VVQQPGSRSHCERRRVRCPTRDRVERPLHADELELHEFSFAKKAAAFLRISRSNPSEKGRGPSPPLDEADHRCVRIRKARTRAESACAAWPAPHAGATRPAT